MTARVRIDCEDADEAAEFDAWLERWEPDVTLSEDEACGCCVSEYEVTGSADAVDDLPPLVVLRPARELLVAAS